MANRPRSANCKIRNHARLESYDGLRAKLERLEAERQWSMSRLQCVLDAVEHSNKNNYTPGLVPAIALLKEVLLEMVKQ